MFQGWIAQFVDPVGDHELRQWAALMLPITIATLAVYSARLFSATEPSPRPATVEYDRHRLGDRRYSSARLWFSAFAAQTTAAVGIDTHLEGDDVLDLELVAIQETMIRATNAIEPDEDLEALEWLTGHYRSEMIEEETGTVDRPALSSCWIAFGTVRSSGWLFGSKSTFDLRLVNAADLGRQAFISLDADNDRRWVGRNTKPLVGLIRETDAAMLGDAVVRIPNVVHGIPEASASDPAQRGVGRRLLAHATPEAVELPLDDEFVGAAHAARLTIADCWEDHWWTSSTKLDLGERSGLTVRCQLFTDTEPRPLPKVAATDRNSTNARA